MGVTESAKSLTVRLPPDLYATATQLAKRRGKSLNALILGSLAAAVKQAEDRELYEAFERLGEDPASDVSYAFEAQAEVALGVRYDED
jgi:hypothetical protein